MAGLRTEVKIYLDPERDQDLIAYIDGLTPGTRSHDLRGLLRRGIESSQRVAPGTIDLAGVRQVLEAVMDEKLAGLAVQATQSAPEDDQQRFDFDAEEMFLE